MTATSTPVCSAVEPKRNSLRKNYIWTFLGSTVHAACQWGLLIALARLGNTEMVGQFTFAIAICAPILLFTNLSLREMQSTDVDNQFQFGDFLGLRILTLLFSLLLITAITLPLQLEWTAILIVLMVGVAKTANALGEVFHGYFQQRERLEYQAWSKMVCGPLCLIGVSFALWHTNNLLIAIAVLCVAELLVVIGCDIPFLWKLTHSNEVERQPEPHSARQYRHALPRFDIPTLSRILWIALPLGVTASLTSLKANLPRYFIAGVLGVNELGVYGVMAYTLVAMDTFIKPAVYASLPQLSRFADTDRTAFFMQIRHLCTAIVFTGLTCCVVTFFFGQWILYTIYGPDYAGYSALFSAMFAVNTLNSFGGMLGLGITAQKQFRSNMLINIASIGVLLISCMLLTKENGLWGAVISMAISATFRIFITAPLLVYRAQTRRTSSLPMSPVQIATSATNHFLRPRPTPEQAAP